MRKSTIPVMLALILAGCQSKRIDRTMMVDPEGPVSYATDIQPIFDQNCGGSGCHVQSTTNGVRLDSYQSTISSRGAQYRQPIILPGDPAGSPIIDKISSSNPEFGRRMPFGRAALSPDEIGLITTWIEEGAEDN